MSFMPLWPNLQPRSTDPLWFNADRPIDDESEVAALELEHQHWVFPLIFPQFTPNYCVFQFFFNF